MKEKFKVWDKEEKKWFEPVYEAYNGNLKDIFIGLNGDLFLRTIENGVTVMAHESTFKNRYIAVWYTGLKDKNNKGSEIYEKDVVYLAGYGNYVVELPFIELYEAMAENDIGVKIGNVLENPELIKESK